MVQFRTKPTDTEYIFPGFKFLSNKNANSLIERGNVRLSTLHEFRDKTRYKGQIVDVDEGIVRLKCHYSFFHGLAKEANGLLPLNVPPFERITLLNQTIPHEFNCENVLVYCFTRFLFSDSLTWAIGEGKDSCVLITEVDSFLDRLSESLLDDSVNHVGVDECIYIGREFLDTDPTPHSISNFLICHPDRIPYIKPKEYANQREIRSIWTSNAKLVDAIIRDVPSLRELCIPVTYPKLDLKVLSDPHYDATIGVRIVKKSSDEPAEFELTKPIEILSPVIHCKERDEPVLGFYYAGADKEFGKAVMRGWHTGILVSEIGLIFGNVPLKDVLRIEFFTSDWKTPIPPGVMQA